MNMISYEMTSQRKPPTAQFNIRLLVTTIERLEKLAEEYKGGTYGKNDIAVEVIETYMGHWEKAASAFKETVKQQLEVIGGQDELPEIDVNLQDETLAQKERRIAEARTSKSRLRKGGRK